MHTYGVGMAVTPVIVKTWLDHVCILVRAQKVKLTADSTLIARSESKSPQRISLMMSH